MTTPRDTGPDDDYWRRPPASDASTEPTEQPAAPGRPVDDVGYAGPPPTSPPPAGWRPQLYLQPPPPRRLPGQDSEALDAAEQRAQRLTYTVAVVAGVVLLVVVCALCSRVFL